MCLRAEARAAAACSVASLPSVLSPSSPPSSSSSIASPSTGAPAGACRSGAGTIFHPDMRTAADSSHMTAASAHCPPLLPMLHAKAGSRLSSRPPGASNAPCPFCCCCCCCCPVPASPLSVSILSPPRPSPLSLLPHGCTLTLVTPAKLWHPRRFRQGLTSPDPGVVAAATAWSRSQGVAAGPLRQEAMAPPGLPTASSSSRRPSESGTPKATSMHVGACPSALATSASKDILAGPSLIMLLARPPHRRTLPSLAPVASSSSSPSSARIAPATLHRKACCLLHSFLTAPDP
mmetsp:Transcript_27763/g.75074  ORF Transcript_27763/g.75074 Transcript_27763/m.75074 type:complete len:291 (-) Transcript_27763:1079-1951(-)